MLTGYYDLAKLTYDRLISLALEQEGLRRGEQDTEVEILPGPIGGFRDDNWPRSVDVRRHLRNNIMVPMCAMPPSCRRVMVHETRPPKSAIGRLWSLFDGIQKFRRRHRSRHPTIAPKVGPFAT
jgi:hypothetical protein